MNIVARFANDESGATAIEYGLIAALIAVGIIAAATTLGFDATADAGLQAQLEAATRAYYESAAGAADTDDDDAWARATARQSHRAWDED